jgi:hypothetical protein
MAGSSRRVFDLPEVPEKSSNGRKFPVVFVSLRFRFRVAMLTVRQLWQQRWALK